MKKTAVINISKISRIAIAIGFGFVIRGTAMGPAFAGGHGEERHHEEHPRGHDRHSDHDRDVYIAPAPSYYYAPPPNYYYAPEPDYYPPAYSYGPPPPPSEGINLFFGGHH